jgi:hypothetical protein
MAGGLGNDTFICDLFDTIIDFNLNEGDKIVGQCSSFDQTEIETSFDDNPPEDFQAGPTPPSFHPSNSPPKEFKLPLPPQQQQPLPPAPPAPPVSHNDIHSQDFGSIPPIPLPPPNKVYTSGPYFK